MVLADFNMDGWPDIAIANDTWPNFLFQNNHDSTFTDVSLISGLAASEDGKYEAGMGIDAADMDGDGLLDVYITHLDFELNRLYHNNGDGTFTDVTYSSDIGNTAIMMSGVAAKFIDYDNDGWPDICTSEWRHGGQRESLPQPGFLQRAFAHVPQSGKGPLREGFRHART